MRNLGLLLAIAVVSMSCASGNRAESVDAAVDGTVADAAPDGPGLGFGENCTDGMMCDSGICLLVGTAGQCSKLCGACPTGYGCLGVTGAVIEGQVSFVCVPTSNQLCSPCSQDSECALLGMDKCVTYADGDRYCSRDCTSVSCPTGYGCEDVVIGGSTFKQCIANSAACDCDATNPGATQPCNIMTPWNVCLGAQTCGGTSGWSTCAPPSPNDDPDPSFVDSNCDGIDGDMARAIFVAGGGSNTATCGLVHTDPCQTIQFAITRAVSASRPHIYVQNGTYSGSITMTNGISIFGGYNFNWSRAPYSDAGHLVTIMGGNPAVTFSGITAATWLDNVVVRSANATGAGASSVAVLVSSSMLVQLRGVLAEPGAGTSGTSGSGGGVGANGGNAGPGTPGCENSSGFCSTCSRPPGGIAGGSTCARTGGVGGLPGLGGGGGLAGGPGNIGTLGGAGAACGGLRSCGGQPGDNGSGGGGGGAGTAGASVGSFSGSTYVPATGGAGINGSAGNGGGGGGGGGGGDDSCNSYGSSGGGGGGGGCGGVRGLGGTGGGGSFGVLAIDSAVVVDGSLLKGGGGGNGGSGGSGGNGGFAGAGGLGGLYGGGGEQDDGGDGAPGGNGGNGGRGGDGGGGGGGPSIAIVCIGSSTTDVSILGTTLTAGNGGAGGASASPGMTGMTAQSLNCPP